MAGSGELLNKVWEYLTDEIAKIHRELEVVQTKLSGKIYHTRTTVYHSDSLPVSGSAPTITINSMAVDNHYASQGSGAVGNQFTTSFNLESGTYTIKIYGLTDTDCGIISWLIDNTVVHTEQDWYSNPAALAIKTFTVNIETDGTHKLAGLVTGKNESSTGHAIKLTKISFVPQVD